MPTHSQWTVLWYDSFHFSGYDSLCSNLTKRYGFKTLHWTSSDTEALYLPGTLFTHRQRTGESLAERSVYCAKEDAGKWSFHAHGTPLAAEDVAAYAARRKADRLNEQRMAELLGRLGAFPWKAEYYALPDKPVYVVRRRTYPPTIATKSRQEILAKTS
jgi:hypothetical protein